ncbi:hypothetical protein HYH02_000596 [Chlamydomonas schloesseri]|uniref:Flagellar associated protein n=1 Tax=Chlamydomonas schloesseri TaxID=2026947 RepID=A0A836BCU2_9CHLO|nr:hypothetical protein HYH02_000596 [Chlamydomonas schloesseri]|eukprot:KAG2454761.1 hypothetical protein HYH02_000596 [Chlamydomonas schloesseri]
MPTQLGRDVQERVKVYAPLNELTHEGRLLTQTLQEELNRSISAPAGPRSPWYEGDPELESMRERVRQQRAIREAQRRRDHAALTASIQKRNQLEEQRRDVVLGSLLGDVIGGLTDPNSPLAEVEAALSHADKVRRKKKESLHNEWSTQVFDTIQGRLQAAVDARDPAAIESRLKSQYDQYLHTTNTKVAVFRDVIIEQDYNPLAAGEATIRVPTGDIRDPLKRDVLKGEYERRLMTGDRGSAGASPTGRGGAAGPAPGAGSIYGPLGKETLGTQHWGELAVKATPYGHCTDGQGGYVARPLSGSAVALRASRVPMDHYGYPVGNAAAAAEVPPGKRIVPGPEQRRGRQDLFDVVQHTVHLKPQGYTGGDQWLEHKGKGNAPGPEQRRGRRDLADVLQQKALADGARGTSAPAGDSQQHQKELGDVWLDAKGKRRVEGPEMRRGRQGLYETLQQTSNPYDGGSKVGDAWLEHKGRKVHPRPEPEAAAALSAVPPLPTVRPPRVGDDKKYVVNIEAAMGQMTVKDGAKVTGW